MTRLAFLHDQLATHLSEIAAARRRTLDGRNPEGLHDLRVALRALRVVLPLLGKQLDPLRREWQIQAQSTGPCRDQEVLLALIATLPDIPASIRDDLIQQEHQSRRALLRQLAAPDLPLLIQRSRIELDTALLQLAPNQLSRRAGKRARLLDSAIKQQIRTLAMNSPPASLAFTAPGSKTATLPDRALRQLAPANLAEKILAAQVQPNRIGRVA